LDDCKEPIDLCHDSKYERDSKRSHHSDLKEIYRNCEDSECDSKAGGLAYVDMKVPGPASIGGVPHVATPTPAVAVVLNPTISFGFKNKVTQEVKSQPSDLKEIYRASEDSDGELKAPIPCTSQSDSPPPDEKQPEADSKLGEPGDFEPSAPTEIKHHPPRGITTTMIVTRLNQAMGIVHHLRGAIGKICEGPPFLRGTPGDEKKAVVALVPLAPNERPFQINGLPVDWVGVGINPTVAESENPRQSGFQWRCARSAIKFAAQFITLQEHSIDLEASGDEMFGSIQQSMNNDLHDRSGQLNLRKGGNSSLRNVDTPVVQATFENSGRLERPVEFITAAMLRRFDIRGHNRSTNSVGKLYSRFMTVAVFPRVVKYVLEGHAANDMRVRMNKGILGSKDALEMSKTLSACISFQIYHYGRKDLVDFDQYTSVQNMVYLQNTIVHITQLIIQLSMMSIAGAPQFRA
jgi:hypothetical protein